MKLLFLTVALLSSLAKAADQQRINESSTAVLPSKALAKFVQDASFSQSSFRKDDVCTLRKGSKISILEVSVNRALVINQTEPEYMASGVLRGDDCPRGAVVFIGAAIEGKTQLLFNEKPYSTTLPLDIGNVSLEANKLYYSARVLIEKQPKKDRVSTLGFGGFDIYKAVPNKDSSLDDQEATLIEQAKQNNTL